MIFPPMVIGETSTNKLHDSKIEVNQLENLMVSDFICLDLTKLLLMTARKSWLMSKVYIPLLTEIG